ncbi:MAG: hypothetical protein ABW202_16165 [Duganella sp.]
MDGIEFVCGQHGLPVREIADVIDGFLVVDRFKVFAEPLAAYGDALADHQSGFLQGQRVPFDPVGLVGVLDIPCRLQIFQLRRIQWAEAVQALLEIVELIDQGRQLVHFRKGLREVEECGSHGIANQGNKVCLIVRAQRTPPEKRISIFCKKPVVVGSRWHTCVVWMGRGEPIIARPVPASAATRLTYRLACVILDPMNFHVSSPTAFAAFTAIVLCCEAALGESTSYST